MKESRRQPSTGQKRKLNTLADSNYVYTGKSISCTNFHAQVMLFTCALSARLQPEETKQALESSISSSKSKPKKNTQGDKQKGIPVDM